MGPVGIGLIALVWLALFAFMWWAESRHNGWLRALGTISLIWLISGVACALLIGGVYLAMAGI